MILVTGGTGLVGANLLLECAKDKEKLRALYRRVEQREVVKLFFLQTEPNQPDLFDTIEWIKADITDLYALEKAFFGITKVYHCAAKVSFAAFHYAKLEKTNIEGTSNLVNLALKYKVKKLVYVSSIAAIGTETSVPLVKEDDSWNPNLDHTGYAHSKYGGELEVWRAGQEGLPIVIVNPGLILGGFFWARSSSSIFSLVKNGIRFYPTGNTAVVAINDVVKCMRILMTKKIINERFILVSENLTTKALLTQMALAVGAKPPYLPLKKELLNFALWLEKIIGFLGLRKVFLSSAFIQTLNNSQSYSGEKAKLLLGSYTPLQSALEKIAKEYQF